MEGKIKRPEILAPAGSVESLRAAVHAGCDAIYIGGDKFGARAYADNPDGEALREAIQYCHLHDKKLYLTINTLLKKKEIEQQLYNYLLPLYEQGLDAVIVQDMGVLSFIHTYFPGLDIHASTQMSLTAAEGARWLREYGVTRIVPARELSLEELRNLRQGLSSGSHSGKDEHEENFYIEIEVFVHGALCYCYSGQCLLSSMNGDRSGNRGRCAQPCRMPYRLPTGEVSHILSPKELCLLPFIPDLIEAGIDSFKIEGRMKKPEYTAFTTAIYRKYTDLYMELGKEDYHRLLQEQPGMLKEDMESLAELYNRNGFTAGYLLGEKAEMLSAKRPNHNGILIGKVLKVKKGQALVYLEKNIDAGDVIEFRNEKEEAIYDYTVGISSSRDENIWIRFLPSAPVKPGNLLYRMRKGMLIDRILKNYLQTEPQIPIRGRVAGEIGKPLTLQLFYNTEKCAKSNSTQNGFVNKSLLYQQGQGKRYEVTVQGMCCEKPQKSPLAAEDIKRLMEKTGQEQFTFEELSVDIQGDIFLPVRAVKELRRQGFVELKKKIRESSMRRPVQEEVCPLTPDKPNGGKMPRLAVQILEKEQLQTVLVSPEVDRIYIPINLFWKKNIWDADSFQTLAGSGKEIFLALPHICRQYTFDALEKLMLQNPGIMGICDGFLIRNQEEYQLIEKLCQSKEFCKDGFMEIPCVLDYNMYIMNPWAAGFWREKVSSWYLPQELSDRELLELVQGMEHTYGMLVYGRQTLMISAQCILNNTKGCISGKKQFYELKDRKNASFYNYNQCDYCYNILYSGKPLYLLGEGKTLKELAPAELRMDFTMESPGEVEKILAEMQEKVLSGWKKHNGNGKEVDKSCYTTGHFHKRIK